MTHFADREAGKHVGILQGVGQRAPVGLGGEARLVRVHVFFATLVDHARGVAKQNVLAAHAQLNVMLRAGNARRAGAIEDHADFADVFAHDFEGIQQRRARNDGRPVLIVVKYRNRHRLAQRLFNLEALRRLDVLQIDAAECRLQKLTQSDDLFRFLGIHLQIEDVDVSESLEQHAFAFHHRLAGQRPNIAETQHRGTIGDHRHQVSAGGVFECQFGLFMNFQAWLRHAWAIGQAQVPLRAARFGGNNFDLALPPGAVVVQRVLFANFHGTPTWS